MRERESVCVCVHVCVCMCVCVCVCVNEKYIAQLEWTRSQKTLAQEHVPNYFQIAITTKGKIEILITNEAAKVWTLRLLNTPSYYNIISFQKNKQSVSYFNEAPI